MRAVGIALAGAAGALTRYGIGLAVGTRAFPWATLGINVTGSFLLAVVLTLGTARWSADVTATIAVGFLGAYTTYSTFSWEAFSLSRDGRLPAAVLYVSGSLVLGLAAAAAGYAIAKRWI